MKKSLDEIKTEQIKVSLRKLLTSKQIQVEEWLGLAADYCPKCGHTKSKSQEIWKRRDIVDRAIEEVEKKWEISQMEDIDEVEKMREIDMRMLTAIG